MASEMITMSTAGRVKGTIKVKVWPGALRGRGFGATGAALGWETALARSMAIKVTSWAWDMAVGGSGFFGTMIEAGLLLHLWLGIYELYLDWPKIAEQDRLDQCLT